jgi:Leucine-rich repeat (LRR) protein
MNPHPELYLQGIGRSVAWQGSTTDEELRLLGQQKSISDVTVLNSTFTDRGVSALAASNSLVKVDLLAAQPLTDAALEGWNQCGELTELSIGPICWTEKSLALLAKLPKLRQLTLRGGTITGGGLQELSRHKSLTRLVIQGVNLEDAGFSDFTSSSLYYLELSGCTLSKSDIEGVAKLTSLAGLNLSGTNLDDEQLRGLLTLVKLESFSFDNTAVTFEGATVLKALKKLNWVSYDGPPGIDWTTVDAQKQRLANTLGWTFQGACSCGCLDISPQPQPSQR